MNVADQIVLHLGGKNASALLGAQFIGAGEGLLIALPNSRNRIQCNRIEVRLKESARYDIVFSQYTKKTFRNITREAVLEVEGDQLKKYIENVTGLYLSLH